MSTPQTQRSGGRAAEIPGRRVAAPVMIMLPGGFSLGGMSTWAIRLAGALSRGAGGVPRRRVVVVTHDADASESPLGVAAEAAGIDVINLGGLPSLRAAAGDLRAFVPAYRDVVERLSRRAGMPCVVCPNSLGDAYGIAAAISMTHPEILRVVGWQHSDIAYDTQVLAHYEPLLSAFVGVSTHITERLRTRLARRAGDVYWVPYGVEVGEPRAVDAGASGLGSAGRPIRLVYTGRLEHEQKRIGALLRLPEALAGLGVASELTLVGDGPAGAEVAGAIARTRRGLPGRLRLVDPASPDRVNEYLDSAEVFVLASRYEGLSVSMLEAMARGCVPVVTHVDSGAGDAIRHGESGLLARAPADASDEEVARSIAREIAGMVRVPGSLRRMSIAASRAVRERFNLERHAALVSEVLDRVAASEPRAWPSDRACAFSASGATGSGSVPADAGARLRGVLAQIARESKESGPGERRVIVHGAGRHTIELGSVLAEAAVPIVGIADDDPAKWGTRLLGWRVCSPAEAAQSGATDVIISSWLHADAVYGRRAVYERCGVRVHHLYR
ncbi:MAG: glycosyltransferase [Phycisphaerales bacterium]